MLLTLPFSFVPLLKKWVMGNMLYKQLVRQTTKVSVAGLHWIFTRLWTEHMRMECEIILMA
jgi:hypothetical protein